MAKTKTFDEKLTIANQIIAKLEQGDLSLEDSIKEYKEGYDLLAECKAMLQEAELEFAKIIEKQEQE